MSTYDELGGFDGLLAICRRWHELCMADPVAAHPFEHGIHPMHDERLAAYLGEVMGGPKLYTAGYGDESSMQRLHAHNGVHPEIDTLCSDFFAQAVREQGVPAEAGQRLSDFFREATVAMRQFGPKDSVVPDGLPMPEVRG